MTLAEIIEEGERLEREATRHTDGDLKCGRQALRLLPSLLAVAKAAVEMRTFIAHDTSDMDPGDTLGWNAMIDRFDAAVRGDAGGEGRARS